MIDEVDERGRKITGKTFLLLLNAHDHAVDFVLPSLEENEFWRPNLDASGKIAGCKVDAARADLPAEKP